jgi:tRNA A-37 threonylcarbamoyl transferase component Bud32
VVKQSHQIESFNLQPGRRLAGKYEVISLLGQGWQGEVYKIREISTNIERAAKLFYPHRNIRNREAATYAAKLHRLVECPILIQYHAQEVFNFRKTPITALISEYVEGELLSDHLKRFRGKRLPMFQAVHLLHALISGIECIHHLGEYHGDLHAENIIVRRLGLTYELKLIDLFHWGRATRVNRQEDICAAIYLFYDSLGGRKAYAGLPKQIKEIICGLKRTLILRKFPNAGDLRMAIESNTWG